jgi:hypothetical protein
VGLDIELVNTLSDFNARRPFIRSSIPSRLQEIFLFCTASRPDLVSTQLYIQWILGAISFGREADHSPPSSAEARNEWSYTSTPSYIFMTWCLIKQRNNFIFHHNRSPMDQIMRRMNEFYIFKLYFDVYISIIFSLKIN